MVPRQCASLSPWPSKLFIVLSGMCSPKNSSRFYPLRLSKIHLTLTSDPNSSEIFKLAPKSKHSVSSVCIHQTWFKYHHLPLRLLEILPMDPSHHCSHQTTHSRKDKSDRAHSVVPSSAYNASSRKKVHTKAETENSTGARKPVPPMPNTAQPPLTKQATTHVLTMRKRKLSNSQGGEQVAARGSTLACLM